MKLLHGDAAAALCFTDPPWRSWRSVSSASRKERRRSFIAFIFARIMQVKNYVRNTRSETRARRELRRFGGRKTAAHGSQETVPASARSRGRRRARSRVGTPGARERRPGRATKTARRSFGTSVTMGQIQKYNNCVRRPALQRRPSPSCSCDALRRAAG